MKTNHCDQSGADQELAHRPDLDERESCVELSDDELRQIVGGLGPDNTQ